MPEFRATGSPVSKGSWIPIRTGAVCSLCKKRSGFLKLKPNDSYGLKKWTATIQSAVRSNWGLPVMAGPIICGLIFYLQKPKNIPKERKGTPCTTPDIDKLTRSVLDALTGTCYEDDKQIVSLSVDKNYATEFNPPGVFVLLEQHPGVEQNKTKDIFSSS